MSLIRKFSPSDSSELIFPDLMVYGESNSRVDTVGASVESYTFTVKARTFPTTRPLALLTPALHHVLGDKDDAGCSAEMATQEEGVPFRRLEAA